MGGILIMAGYAGMVIGHILIVVAAFRAGILWGLGCLFVPFVGLIFLISHWEEAKSGFMLEIAGIGIMFLGPILFGERRNALLHERDTRPVRTLVYEAPLHERRTQLI